MIASCLLFRRTTLGCGLLQFSNSGSALFWLQQSGVWNMNAVSVLTFIRLFIYCDESSAPHETIHIDSSLHLKF